MTSTTSKPNVNFPTEEEGEKRGTGAGCQPPNHQQQQQQQHHASTTAATTTTTISSGMVGAIDPSSIATSAFGGMFPQPQQQQQQQHVCIVCTDESDGLHFGQFTCRACAAFFRRTVSLKLHYTCKRDGKCDMDKAARNTCRACRYRKCLQCGMLTSAVQHARDGIGKRTKSAQKISTGDMPDIKMPKERTDNGGGSGELGLAVVSSSSAPFIQAQASGSSDTPAGQLLGIQPAQLIGVGTNFGAFTASGGVRQSPSLLEQTLYQLNVSSQFAPMPNGPQQQQQQSNPLIGTQFTNLLAGQPAVFPSPTAQQFIVQPQQQPSTSTGISPQQQTELKYLHRMLEGYYHFTSLRKASYTLVEGFPLNKHDDNDCPQSNFGTSKKICKIEASLIMDTVDKFFTPFNQLPTDDKHKMFDPFYCLFSNAERAFRTYKMFGAGDDRLLMPDGGYVRLSELQKFYENNTLVRGDPGQVARIFENAMHYLVKTVVAHMRNIELEEMELMTLFGMFIWNDSEEISSEAQQMAQRMRNEIILDLHLYYRSLGLSEADITLKTANLFLLIPKLEQSVRLLNDNYCISELFDMLSLSGSCKRINRCALIGD